MKRNLVKIAELSLLALLIALTVWFMNQVGIEQVRSHVNQLGIWAPLVVLLLRLTRRVREVGKPRLCKAGRNDDTSGFNRLQYSPNLL